MTEASDAGAPRVIPPPLVYVGALVGTALLDRAMPLRLPDFAGRRAVGWALVVAGQAASLSGVATFRRRRTTLVPGHEATTLVTTGPYVYTRNPMYVGLTTSYVGGALLTGSWWSLIATPGIVAYIDRAVIRLEEGRLRRQFGAAYEDFARHTRRWV